MNAPVFLLHPGKQVTQGWNRDYCKKNLISVIIILVMKLKTQNRQINAPVFLLHPGKQVTQGRNREITKKKLNSVIILMMKMKTYLQSHHKTGKI